MGYSVKPFNNSKQIGLSLPGEVLAADSESVKVHLDIDEQQEEDTAYSFPFFPDTGNGLYCRPEVGTRVFLKWGSEQDGDVKAVHCVRENGNSCEEMSDYNQRYFTTADGKRMAVLPEKLFFGYDDEEITIADQSGIAAKTAKKIIIEASDVTIHAEKSTRLTTPEQFKAAKTGKISGVEMSSGKINVKSDNVSVVQGRGDKKTKLHTLPGEGITMNKLVALKAVGSLPAKGKLAGGK